MNLITPPFIKPEKRSLQRIGGSIAVYLPKKLMKKINMNVEKEDYIFFFPVWSPEEKKWFMLLCLNESDWED